MDRRGFLGGLMGTAAAATFDLEKALWMPTKKIFIPAPAKKPRFTILGVEVGTGVPIYWDTETVMPEVEQYYSRSSGGIYRKYPMLADRPSGGWVQVYGQCKVQLVAGSIILSPRSLSLKSNAG